MSDENFSQDPLLGSKSQSGPIRLYDGRSSQASALEQRHIFGFRPVRSRTNIEIQAAPTGTQEGRRYITSANIIWTVLVGWWVALCISLLGVVMCLTIFGYRLGLACFRLAGYILYPFGYYAYVDKNIPKPNYLSMGLFWVLGSIMLVIPAFLGATVSWLVCFYLPMSKFLISMIKKVYVHLYHLRFAQLRHHNPKSGTIPSLLIFNSGSFMYFKYSVMDFEIIYLNLFPFIILAFYLGYLAPEDSPIAQPISGAFISIIATIPCMYVIGVCTEILSRRCGLVLGALINAIFTGLVEIILFFFSLRKDLGDVVRAAVTGAFLMNLLVIPGLSMFAAGIKWTEVHLNRKVQSVSGTFLLLAIVAIFFPAVYYGMYQPKQIECHQCNETAGLYRFPSSELIPPNWVCKDCDIAHVEDLSQDKIYMSFIRPLTYCVSIIMPIIYVVGLIFSLKTHKYIYDQFEKEQDAEENTNGSVNTYVCVAILLISCVLFSIICEIFTDKLPPAMEHMNITDRFVGLIFYTIIPAVAEFMNAIRFALEGNIGLSLEISNQGAMVVSLIQIPALVLMSIIMGKTTTRKSFHLLFELIDVYAVVISVLLRNFMMMEKSINYLNGFAFLVVFVLISIVYFFDPF